MSLLLVAITGLLAIAHAAVVPFTVQGALDSASADTTAYNSGGRISVNGLSIVIPQNLQFQFPAAWVPFKNVAGGGFTGMEVAVVGNYVDDVAIAGQVQISQFLLGGSAGTIASLAFDGKITLTTGQVLRINDPKAVYSAGYTARPEFTADDENPSISSFSGFPMCVPRSADDVKCPSSNRPSGQTTFTAPDSLTMAPLKPGDYIEYSGVRINGETLVYALVAQNVQILTTGVPPYIRVEEAIIGIVDTQAAANIENADTRFVGYTTDASVAITISRIDVSPCDGKETYTSVGSASIRAGDARNKWIWRAGASTLTKYSRDYLVTTSTGTRATNGGQITAGRYVQPVTEWIYPESTVPGRIPGPNDFSQMVHLRDGTGPDDNGDIWGQLKPWPLGGTAPTPFTTNCPAPGTGGGDAPTAVTADAGADQTLRAGMVAALTGSAANSASFPSGDLSYSWAQKTGNPITLSGATTSKCSFTLPNITTTSEFYELELTVKSASLKTTSTDIVKVTNDPSTIDTVTIDSYTYTTKQGGTVSVNAHSNVVDGSARLTIQLNNPSAGTAITMVNAGGGKFTYNARSTKQPSAGITVTSNYKGKSSRTTLSTKKRRSFSA
ncbi:hypothetical protein KVT40_006245 [Elsinoe batatas]|uniref:Uncharacterized protein n=1 Tax=Elsinoe batatas TaxID=2601811 RepID=A0A8K0PHQ5_9PEZI|nr:hypothetical protein KVT40_006245 [Elsinoe batatas]